MAEQTMLAISADWNGAPTFKLMPAANECPFNEVIFDPNTKMLAVISKDAKERPQMLPKLNDRGEYVALKGGGYAQERRMMAAYYEYYVSAPEDIKMFVERFVINQDHPVLTTVLSELAA